jgi:N-methylhydantoinase B
MQPLAYGEKHVYHPHDRTSPQGRADRADVITTQLVRNALDSAAHQMKRVLIRTSFSPTVYEAYDFAVAIYDREIRMLAQAPTIPLFMGTMSFSLESALEGVGGESAVEPGDVIIYNVPYGNGSHAPDMAIVMPSFYEDELVGYVVTKAHLTDIGAKNPFTSDSTDVFQEGILFPGVKLYRRGELVTDVLRILLANSRAPQAVEGDVMAEIASCRAGAEELQRILGRFGLDVFRDCVERMYDHGETVTRDFIKKIPNGAYRGTGHLDNDGIGDEPITFDVELTVEDELVRFDLSAVPDALRGPLNCPFPATVSACRIVLAMLSGSEAPNEGHFRPLEVTTRVGSMFHPVLPQPSFMWGWPAEALLEAMFQALSEALPGVVPSGTAGDVVACAIHTFDQATGELQVVAPRIPVGSGALPDGDGSTLYHPSVSMSRLSSAELEEAKAPFVQIERWEFTPDSAGAGQYRGGMGWELDLRVLTDVEMMTTVERTKVPSWGQAGGLSGTPNGVILRYPDGRSVSTTKVTGVQLPAQSVVSIRAGGGGGYGDPADREIVAVHRDLAAGLITEESARALYPHAFA